jgi:hypothetical protein
MRCKQLVGAMQSAVCNGTQNSHCGVVDNSDHDQSQVNTAQSCARLRQQRTAPAIDIPFDERAPCMKHSTWSSWLASAFMSKRSRVRERLLASRAGNFVEGLRALRGGEAVARRYEIFCWPQQCSHTTLATAAAILLFDASPFNCATLTEGCSATPTPLHGCPVLTAGTAPPQHCWSRHAASVFTTLLCATWHKGACWGSSQLLWAPGFGGQPFGQQQHQQPKCRVVPGHSSSSWAAVLIVCSSLSAVLL